MLREGGPQDAGWRSSDSPVDVPSLEGASAASLVLGLAGGEVRAAAQSSEASLDPRSRTARRKRALSAVRVGR